MAKKVNNFCYNHGMSIERPRIVLVNRSLVLDKMGKGLYIRRAANDSWHAKMWEFPGGKLEEGKDISHALEDEVMEETGLLVSPSSRLVYYESFIIPDGRYKNMPYVVLFGVSKSVGGKFRLSEEHDAYQWLPTNEAFDLDLTPETWRALAVFSKRADKKGLIDPDRTDWW